MAICEKNVLTKAYEYALAYLEGLNQMSVAPGPDSAESTPPFIADLPLRGLPSTTVLNSIAQASRNGLMGSSSGRFFGWVIGGVLPSALAVDWLVSTWDQNAALYACSPAAATVERIAGRWLLELLDLPRHCSFSFTTGCQMAHVTCLAAARHRLLQQHGWNVEAGGLWGSTLPISVFINANAHGSINRTVKFLGIGTNNLVLLDTSADGKIDPHTLRAMLRAQAGPKILVLNAGDISIGSYDDFNTLIPIAKEFDAWVHIDGAFGLVARASTTYKQLLDGVDLADSWATDAHKWLNVPFDCGFAVVRDSIAHRESMTGGGSYVTTGGPGQRDQIDWTPEWSRRARGFPVYAALLELGAEGVQEMIDRCCYLAQELVAGLARLNQVEVLWMPSLNQGLVRFLSPLLSKGEDTDDRFTESVVQATNSSGEAFFTTTSWRGKRAMRVSVVNWRTTMGDVERAIKAVEFGIMRANKSEKAQ